MSADPLPSQSGLTHVQPVPGRLPQMSISPPRQSLLLQSQLHTILEMGLHEPIFTFSLCQDDVSLRSRDVDSGPGLRTFSTGDSESDGTVSFNTGNGAHNAIA